MKAAVYSETGPPEVFRYADVPDPVCAPDGVVVDVRAISIEGGDTLNRLGGLLVTQPHIVGYQCAGVVCEVGEGVGDLRVGDRVVCIDQFGSHAEKRAVPASSTWLVPESLELERAACVPIALGTADDCLFEFGDLKAGESVLVHAGAGGLGMALIQLAHRAGATVLATASNPHRLDGLVALGMDHGIDYQRTDFVPAARSLTGGRGPDLVVDSVGGETLEKSIECAAYRGRIVSVGDAGRGTKAPNPSGLRAGNKRLTGVFLGAELVLDHDRVHPMIAGHLEAVAKGELDIVIDRSFPLSEAAQAHAFIESRQAFGRVLLIP
jgi:NADPH:quinone reductase